MSKQETLRIYPLGGVGEIGRNCMVWEYGDWRLLIDCGLTFPEDTHYGVQYLLPDWSGLIENPFPNQAVILTHGHDDHIGALPFFLKEMSCPVYGTDFALALVESRLKEHHLDRVLLHPMTSGKRVLLGPFTIEPVHVNHSIPQAVALSVETPVGRIVHVTDWKIDRTPVGEAVIDEARFRALGKEGVTLLLSDSTNAERHGYTLSEIEIGKTLLPLSQAAKGRLFVTLFASNAARIAQVMDIARACGRKVVLCGRSLERNLEIFQKLGIIDVAADKPLSLEEGLHCEDRQVLFILTGSQAEPRSVLYRMSYGGHKQLKTREGDTIIFSSKMIPGNERAITRMINQFCRYGAKVIYEDIADVHTSGHAKQGELADLVSWLRPEYFVPIHGEYRHLVQHAEIANAQGVSREKALVIENGQELLIDRKGVRLGEKKKIGRLFVDGTGLGDVEEEILRDRRYLSKTGVLICMVMVNSDTGELMRDPELVSRGFFNEEGAAEIFEQAKQHVVASLQSFDFHARTNAAEVEAYLDLMLRQFFNKVVESKPLIIPIVVEV